MYRIEFANAARRDMGELVEWYSARNPATAARLSRDLRTIAVEDSGKNPNRYPYFWITGKPYRGRLYQMSRWTKFWIVKRTRDAERCVDVLRIWNASRDPSSFEL